MGKDKDGEEWWCRVRYLHFVDTFLVYFDSGEDRFREQFIVIDESGIHRMTFNTICAAALSSVWSGARFVFYWPICSRDRLPLRLVQKEIWQMKLSAINLDPFLRNYSWLRGGLCHVYAIMAHGHHPAIIA